MAVEADPDVEVEVTRAHSDSVRVAASKVYDLLDAVGEADLGARRVEQTTGMLLSLAAEQARWVASLRQAATGTAGCRPTSRWPCTASWAPATR